MTAISTKAVDEESIRLNAPVFFTSATVILLLGLLVAFFPIASQQWLSKAQTWMSDIFGWYYMLLMVVCMVFVFWLALSRFGHMNVARLWRELGCVAAEVLSTLIAAFYTLRHVHTATRKASFPAR